MSDATVAAAASVVVAVITAVVGPFALARYKARHGALASSRLSGGRLGRPLIPARPGARPPAPKPASRLRALGLTGHAGRAADVRVVLREPGPRAVLARLAEIPPLSRRAVAEELYVGRWADWDGVVRAIRESADGYQVDVVDDADGTAAARLEFAAAERPVLESLREGDRVRYAARVTGAEDGVVTLDAATVTRVA